MTKDQKTIKAKIGLLELAKQLCNVSQACKMLGYVTRRTTVTASVVLLALLWAPVASSAFTVSTCTTQISGTASFFTDSL
jgi:hypothetical protein